MRYLSWAAFYEGPSDGLYLDIILPRLIRDLIAGCGTDLVEVPDAPAVKIGLHHRAVDKVAEEACSSRAAFDILFVHADTGGRGSEKTLPSRSEAYCTAIHNLCDRSLERCVTITPRHETEAWLLADASAVTGALGYSGLPEEIGLPNDARIAEQVADPKLVLTEAINAIVGRRRRPRIENVFPAIAQRQQLALLRRSPSFAQFEQRLRTCLRNLMLIA